MSNRRLKGEEVGTAKLTTEQVIELRRRRYEGESVRSIAAEMGISQGAASRAARGMSWSHVRAGEILEQRMKSEADVADSAGQMLRDLFGA